ncbi:MAG TPA: class E sortase [Acidimicrobiales bacterium]|nr:class E sortase [Acidimicrobiales bacterium]
MRRYPTRTHQRLLAVASTLVLLAGVVSVAVDAASPDVVLAAAPTTTTTSTTTTTTTTTTTVPEVVPVELSEPEAPPTEAYAAEPHVVIGRIEIPKLGLDAALNQGIALTSIDRGPSHWPGTALPGQAGNTVVAGHRVTKTRPFREIHRLEIGDEMILTGEQGRFVYRVNATDVVTPDALYIVDQTPEPTATIFACHPPGSARYRYVVTFDLVGPPAGFTSAGAADESDESDESDAPAAPAASDESDEPAASDDAG